MTETNTHKTDKPSLHQDAKKVGIEGMEGMEGKEEPFQKQVGMFLCTRAFYLSCIDKSNDLHQTGFAHVVQLSKHGHTLVDFLLAARRHITLFSELGQTLKKR